MDAMMQQMAHMNMMSGMGPPCRHRNLVAMEFADSFAFTCDGCQEMGYGSCYNCSNGCDYQLHEECITASQVAHHHFFEQRRFTLQRKEFPNSSNLCTACGMAVTGWRYFHTLQSGNCIFLHPGCMKMPHCIETDDGDTLFLKQKLVSLECDVCEHATLGGPINGWAYVSSDQELVCHVKCMKDTLYEDWSMYAFMEELEGTWWLNPYADLHSDSDSDSYSYSDLDDADWVEPRNPSRPVASQQILRAPIQAPRQQVAPAARQAPRQQVVQAPRQRPAPRHQAAPAPRRQQAVPRQQQQRQYHNNNLVPWAGPSSSSRVPARPAAPAQGRYNNNNNLALTTTRPTGRKRRIFWKLTQASVKLLFSFATSDPTTAFLVVSDTFEAICL